MDIISQIVARAKASKQHIVLPEGTEERTLQAADRILADEVANLTLIGNPTEIREKAERLGLKHIEKALLINPNNHPRQERYATLLLGLRKNKGMTLEKAREMVKDPLYLGCLIIKAGDADGELAGAENTTGNVLRPALQIIKTQPGINTVSGAMMMVCKEKQFGENGVLFMSDIAVTPEPTAEQLAQFAITTAQTAQAVGGFEEPRVAMLSFSTHGSAKHEQVDKVVEATRLAREMAPELAIDGELQSDAALAPEVGLTKAPTSTVAGRANILIVPNLSVGNIGYKLVQRLGGAEAIGPLLQGIARPVNDLSRGCSVDDVYTMIAVTAVQAIAAKQAEEAAGR
ncbi:MAG: phosphate acetyltransferase [Bacteroidales bacterium]|nr:phosphate acetyltransferase [Bacteroidales bacterium]